MKNIVLKKVLILFGILLITSIVNAQTPAVPTTPTASGNCGNGEILLTRGTPPSGVTWYWQQYSYQTDTSNSATVLVVPSYTSIYYLRAQDNSTLQWSEAVSVDCSTIDPYGIAYVYTPYSSDISKSSNSDGSVTLTRGNPPSGITWYWQSSSDGTSLSNSNTSIRLTTGSIYYLRAYDNATGCWSSGSASESYTVTWVNPPPIPTVTPNCSSVILTRVTPPTGITYYWQSYESGSSKSDSNQSITRNYGTEYFIRAYNANTNKWSNATIVNFTTSYDSASRPSSSSVTVTNNFENTVLTRTNPPSGENWYWQSTSDGTDRSAIAANQSITLTSGNTYYLRAWNYTSGCWSSARSISYSIITTPTPDIPSVIPDCSSVILTRGTPPLGITWYWQSSEMGTSTITTAQSITRTYGSTYYLRAKDNTTGEWSLPLTINYTISSDTPVRPDSPTITNNFGNTVLTRVQPPSGIIWYWQSQSDGTTKNNSNESITLTNGSIYYLRAYNSISGCWSSSRSISYSIIDTPTPTVPTITYNCGTYNNTVTLTRDNPPTGVTWYWQSSAIGTSTYSSNEAQSITRTSGNIYYLRAREDSTGKWSLPVSINYTINSIPSTPSSYSISTTNNDGNTVLTRSNPPSGVTYYWQASSNGTSTNNLSESITLTSGTTYYLRGQDNETGCWGNARSINYTIRPNVPSIPTITYNCGSNSNTVTLTRGTPPSGFTWYWQSSATRTYTSNSNESVTLSSGSVYYLKSRENATGVWSNALNINYTINSKPSTPSSYSISTTKNDGNTILTRSNPPSGVTYYWQSTSTGESTIDSNESIILTSGTVYYLRGRDDVTGCWGTARSVSYTIRPNVPSMPTVTYTCGSSSNTATLTREVPPSGITWYWQSSVTGTSTTKTTQSITRAYGNTYYLRARNNSTYEWSSSLIVNYVINSKPTKPTSPMVVNNSTSVTITRGNPPNGITWYWQSTSDGESEDDANPTKILTTSTVHYLRARDNITGCWSDAREIGYAINPDVPTVTYNCGSNTNTATLTRGTPPTGVTWYWQSSVAGISTTLSKSAETYTRSSGSIYYLRARNNITGDWSGATAVNYQINNKPSTPSSSSVSVTKNDGSTSLTRSTPPSGVTYYWQSTSGGTSVDNSSETITLTSGTTHYLRGQDNETGCWGNARSVSYTIKPSIPTLPTVTYNCGSSSNTATLTREIPPEGVTWYWQSSETGTSTTKTTQSITRTYGNTYYLRARNNSTYEWSSSLIVNYTINLKPDIPSLPIVIYNPASVSITRENPPNGITWFWQNTIDGISISDSNASVTLVSGSVYYLRGLDEVTGCWGVSRRVDYILKPETPTIVQNCGNTVLTKTENIPDGVSWYWQSSEIGTSISSSNSEVSVIRTEGTTYYLRARNNTSYDWSDAITIDYTIDKIPNIPDLPSVTNTIGNTLLTMNGTAPSSDTWYWQSEINGIDTSNSNSTVTLSSGDTYYLRAKDNDSNCWSDAKVINYTVIPNVPDMPAIVNNCGETILTKGNPVNNEVVWYWQNSSQGTDTSNSEVSISLTSGTIYYLRALNTISNTWSDAVTVNYVVKPIPTTPNLPNVTYNNGGTTLSFNGNPENNVIWYWQSNIDGVETTNQDTSITLTSGTNYYLRAYDSSSDCWSDARVINYSVETDPIPPTILSVENGCGSSILTKNNPLISSEVWYWQSYATGTSTSNSSVFVTRTYGDYYYLRAYNTISKKWSTALEISYTIIEKPVIPSIISVTHSNGMATITRGNPPAGITWYWQSSYLGTFTNNSNLTVSVPEGAPYYIRAYDAALDCWSTFKSINTLTNEVPAPPTLTDITITNNCGNTVLTKASPPSGILWYWQTSSNGTNLTGGSVASKTLTSGNTYYLRALNYATMNWSTALSINYTINNGPSIPDLPIITYNVGSTTLTKDGTAPTDVTWYWQSSVSGEDISPIASNNDITLSSGTVYYLRAKNTNTGCWGAARMINYVISDTVIEIPTTPIITENCGSTTLTKNGSAPTGLTWHWQSTIGGEDIDANSLLSTITLTSGTTYYLRTRENVAPYRWSSTLPVDYTVTQTPTPPTLEAISIVNNSGNTQINITGNIPADVTWYWQTSALGTDIVDSSNSKEVTEGTAIYLRAKNNNVTDCWGDALTIEYTVDANPVPTPLLTSTTKVENCGSTVLNFDEATVPTGVSWYWQQTSTGENTTNSSSSITLTEGTSYYLKAQDNISGIWSSEALEILYTINEVPEVPSINPIVYQCGSTTITRNSSPTGVTWYWQTAIDGIEETDTLLTKEFNSDGTAYLRAKSTNGCWSDALEINYSVEQTPEMPTLLDISLDYNCNQTTITKNNPPIGVTWYWQTTIDGIEETDTSLSKEFNLDGTIYLRAKNNAITNCWSDVLTINYTINTESTWYADSDNDGFGNPAISLIDCSEPVNYVNNADDLDDTNINITNIAPQYFYRDIDGDGFGDSADSVYYSVKPVGYVTNNTDNCPNEFGMVSGCDTYTNPTLSDENYVYTRTFQIETTTGTVTSNKDVIENITYFDGLGRPMQSIGIKQSATQKDIITHIGYDAFGRQDKGWLPYPETNGINGSYRGDISSATQNYYQVNYSNDFNIGTLTQDIAAYSQKDFEASPLNRVLKQAAPGDSWKLGSDNEIEFDYKTNTDTTEVRLFEVTLDSSYNPTLSTSGHYGVNELYKTITRDENHAGITKNHTTEEFKDKQGRVVLKRTYADIIENGIVTQTEATHDTYYVYDDFGNLTYVLPPKMDASANDIVTINNQLNDLGYQYQYDYRNRLVEKQIPGKEREYIVYDKLDRPILTQDANQRTNDEWLFTKYDVFGRVAYTGIYTYSSVSEITQGAMQTLADNHLGSLFESKQASSTNNYYSNVAYPTVNTQVLTVNYYDNYNFDTTTIPLTTVFNDTITTRTKGLATGSKVKVLGQNNNWITTTTYYDDKARPIYVSSQNEYLGTTDIIESELDFVGKTKRVKTTHSKTGQTEIVTEDTFVYDNTGRLKSQNQTINGSTPETIVINIYDELGQLTSKGVGNTETTPLQTVDYAYNIRGWLKTINNDVNTTDNDLFNFKINYNVVDHGGTPLFNGNIAETEWETQNDNVQRWYTYQYDALNRITNAIDNSTDNRYSLTLVDYDKNGNIQHLNRNGHTNIEVTDFGVMDNLSYYYNGNQLHSVTDAAVTTGFKDGNVSDIDFNTTADNDYTYDENGNLLMDNNKGITNIAYNHLNLPTQVTFAEDKYINYIYDATGIKIEKVVTDLSNITKTKYAGNYIYEEAAGIEELKFFNQPEGYVEPDGNGGFEYIYQYKDHLGNIRLSYTDENQNNTNPVSLTIVEENNYYPFGLKHKGYNNVQNGRDHKFEFQGQEAQEELGLDWISFKWRNHDPAIGRFMSIDPLAEDYVYQSPYNFSENRVIDGVELEGLEHVSVTSYDVRKTDVGYVAVQTGQKQYRNIGDWSGTKKIDSYSVYDQNGKVIRTSTGSIDLRNNGIDINSVKNREVSFGQVVDWYANSDDRAAKGFRSSVRNTALAASLIVPAAALSEGVTAFGVLSLASSVDSFVDENGNVLSDRIENKDAKLTVKVGGLLLNVGGKALNLNDILKGENTVSNLYEAIRAYFTIYDSKEGIKNANNESEEEDNKE